MPDKKTTRILGIDPGFAITGWGIIEHGKESSAIGYGCIKTTAGTDYPSRLISISRELDKVIKKFNPGLAVIEQLFFCKNVKTGIQVGEARGIAILTMAKNGLPIHEFTPLQVKQAVTGYGRASKTQVQRMVQTLLGLSEIPQPDDVTDALAIAICGAMTRKFQNPNI
ncbi:crossover junction endodeoxyribonuclease RuvC [Patescibacteria group bacterium]|nr:crossover junction endodeoxyribonuclease RuvC [Patescibacteria group bacterium]MBU1921870.1 crossover junction endodeoxyribonuclease RuvC [Patescibacteria group bacterium]